MEVKGDGIGLNPFPLNPPFPFVFIFEILVYMTMN